MKRFLLCLSVLLAMFNIKIGAYVRYVTTNLNLRYGPGVEYEVLVEYGGYIGYISTKYLSCDPPRKKIKRETRVHTYNWYTTTRNTGVRYYTNVDGYRVQSPTYYNSAPAGATALCRDGTYSFSRNRRGTCSHHGGVARWL